MVRVKGTGITQVDGDSSRLTFAANRAPSLQLSAQSVQLNAPRNRRGHRIIVLGKNGTDVGVGVESPLATAHVGGNVVVKGGSITVDHAANSVHFGKGTSTADDAIVSTKPLHLVHSGSAKTVALAPRGGSPKAHAAGFATRWATVSVSPVGSVSVRVHGVRDPSSLTLSYSCPTGTR